MKKILALLGFDPLKHSVKVEMMAGLTTFLTMSYILAVNPLILGETGMDKGALFTATIAAAVIALLVIVLIVRKKVSDHKLAVEQFRSQVERDQNRIHELVSDMENLIRTNDDLRRDRQTLSQKDLLMTSKIMGRNKVYTTAQSLGDQVTADTMNFALSDDDWADFISLTDLVYDGFSQRLLELYPKLGKWDVRICCLSKNGFSNQVISILLDTQTESYYRRKTRIKQMKMNLMDDTRTFEEIVNAV